MVTVWDQPLAMGIPLFLGHKPFNREAAEEVEGYKHRDSDNPNAVNFGHQGGVCLRAVER